MTSTTPDHRQRLTAGFLWAEIVAFISGEKGALHTTSQLCKRPGATIRDYIGGSRDRLTNPIRYLLLTCALVTAAFVFGFHSEQVQQAVRQDDDRNELANAWSNVTPELMKKVTETRQLLQEIGQQSEDKFLVKNSQLALDALDRSFARVVSEISLSWMNVFLLLALPVNSIITWVCFRHAKLNLTEHVVANAFILGIQNLAAIGFVLAAFFGWVNFLTGTLIYMFFSFVYQFIAWRQAFCLRGVLANSIGVFGLLVSIVGFFVLQGIATMLVYLVFAR